MRWASRNGRGGVHVPFREPAPGADRNEHRRKGASAWAADILASLGTTSPPYRGCTKVVKRARWIMRVVPAGEPTTSGRARTKNSYPHRDVRRRAKKMSLPPHPSLWLCQCKRRTEATLQWGETVIVTHKAPRIGTLRKRAPCCPSLQTGFARRRGHKARRGVCKWCARPSDGSG